MPKAILLQRKTQSFTFLTVAKFNFKHLNTLFINTLPKVAKFFRFSVKSKEPRPARPFLEPQTDNDFRFSLQAHRCLSKYLTLQRNEAHRLPNQQ